MKRIVVIVAMAMIWSVAQANDSISSVISMRDTMIVGDSVLIIHTVCAPICSSVVYVMTKEGKRSGRVMPPKQTPFAEAYIEEGKLKWRDNEYLLLDEEERKR